MGRLYTGEAGRFTNARQVIGADRPAHYSHSTTNMQFRLRLQQKLGYIYISKGVRLEYMRKKLVVLDEETYELAQKKPNFSEWVRSMLLLHDERRKEQDEIAFKIWKETGEWPEWYV